MAACPKCGQAIDADFGMFNCPSCQAFLSVDLDGQVSIAVGDDPLSPEQNALNNVVEEPAADNIDYGNFDSFDIDPSIAKAEAEPSQDLGVAIGSENELPDISDLPNASAEIEAEAIESTRVLDSANLDDVVAFGNSELSSSQTGGILYDIYLSGIDTAEIREEIRLHIEDKKFLWNVEDLLRSIKNGRLIIRRVNAVKTAIFIQRIKHLDIDIQWKQHEIVRL